MITADPACMAASARILVVDDEPLIRDFVSRGLVRAGYRIDLAADGATGVQLACTGSYGLVLLDLMMSDMDGRAALTQIQRQVPGLPVMILSCVADVSTKVECLELGAQDYLTKPFSLAELAARVRARLRDARGDTHRPADGHQHGTAHQHEAPHQHGTVHQHGDVGWPGSAAHGDLVRAGALVLDVSRLAADNGHGPVALTRLEFLLLRELVEHDGRSVPKDQLLSVVWGLDFDPGSNVVDVCVRRLRSKLGFSLIKTVRGAGYQLAS